MIVKCFGCAASEDGEDTDAVTQAFVDHGRDCHNWSYPETAVRNYARNYAEATERLTGGTERLPEIGEITTHALTQSRVDDWLRFFDHDAFAGNPDWASCYFLEPPRACAAGAARAGLARHSGRRVWSDSVWHDVR